MDGGPEITLKEQAETEGSQWAPLAAGLFGGSLERAMSAFNSFNTELQTARTNTH
jgi:hypothetical protein